MRQAHYLYPLKRKGELYVYQSGKMENNVYTILPRHVKHL